MRSTRRHAPPRRGEPPHPHRTLQVVENWNSANDKIFYGRGSVLTGADREHAEVLMLALRFLQSSLVLINTQLLRAVGVLRDPQWAGKRTAADRRGLSPLLWSHVNGYWRFHFDMDSRFAVTGRWACLAWPGCRLLPVAVMRRRALPRRALSFR
ncbi:Tn3 family transposase [Streptomyces sp. NPDC001663]|uniref:Tn3 family transposase n=1 Tax=Streptomyces sp. NPDC001663 TaxID=3364597 RepID=UPI00368D66A2